MAIRDGGRYELEGSSAVLALPAEGVEAREDVARLQQELDEARRQGEAYARELAAVWTVGEEGLPASSFPPATGGSAERYGLLARFSGGIAAALRSTLSPIGRELAELRSATSPRKSSPDLESAARAGLDERVESIRRKLLAVQELVAELASVGETDPHEARRAVDLLDVVRGEVRALEARAARVGVDVRVEASPDESARPMALVAPRAIGVLVHELLSHAIAASARGSAVRVIVAAGDRTVGTRIMVDDSGTIVPAAARPAILALEVEPGTFGRPSSVALFIAAETASAQGAAFDVGDAPVQDGAGGGVRITVAFPVLS
jgi:signal transduction histidine kinase